jgi:FecR protein
MSRKAACFSRVLTMVLAFGATSCAFASEDGVWKVSKSSGEVWMTTSGVQSASLGQEDALKPGDIIRTGRNGRVLLTRGEETIVVSPNSVIGLPTEKKDGLSTTIVQQAGSILLEVEKRNVQHFEVETPYLAAVVKGTQFQVSVNDNSTSVSVLRGQVEVTDFKSGQIAQVMPGQVATAFERGNAGLSLRGSGTLHAIEQGKPRASSIERIMVPKTGLAAPRSAMNGQLVHPLGHLAASSGSKQSGVTRISTSLGEVRLNFPKVTHGLARGMESPSVSVKRSADNGTIWSAGDAKASQGTGSSNSADPSNGNGNGSGNSNSSAGGNNPGVGAATSAVAAANNQGNGGANGNGKANENGNGNGKGKP